MSERRPFPAQGGRSVRAFSDVGVVVLAVATWAGAWVAPGVPVAVAAAGAVLALAVRRPVLVVVAAALLAGALAARAQAGLVPPRPAAFHGVVTLLTDAEPVPGGVRAEARVGRRHLRLEAHGAGAGPLREGWAGQRLVVEGRVGPLPFRSPALRARHVAGRLTVSTARAVGGEEPWWRAARWSRRRIEGLGEGLPSDERSLFDGFVLGDDRHQTVEVAADFRASGLTHLLVVSGENVAFVLALAGPVLKRTTWGARWALTAALLAAFALLTRFEPSVLRAVAMAAIATTASAVGRPAPGWRTLGLAVAGLLLVDPFLARSAGFAMSVAASAGILAFARPLEAALPGPRAVARVAAVTAAAQAGVAPLVVVLFGGIPVAGLPANVAAAPGAAGVVVWGLPLLLVGRLLGGGAGAIVRWPAGLMLGWVLAVARWAARLPTGQAGMAVTVVASLAVGAAALAAGAGAHRVRRAALVVSVAALLWPGASAWVRPPSGTVVDGLLVEQRGGATVVVAEARVEPGDALDGLSAAAVRRIDVLVVARGGPADAALVQALRHRWTVRSVLAPAGNEVRGATVPATGSTLAVGSVTVRVEQVRPRLAVTVSRP